MLDENAVLDRIRSIKGAVAVFPADEEVFRKICFIERSVSTTTAGMAMDNRALEVCMMCRNHVVIFCDGDLELPESHTLLMEDLNGNVIGFDVPPSMRRECESNPDLVWLSDDFVIRPDADICSCRMVMLPKEMGNLGEDVGVGRTALLFPNTDTDLFLKRRFGFDLDDPNIATAVLGYDPL